MYIGRALTAGNYLKLDNISSQFNGSRTIFNLTSGGNAFYPGSAFSILVSVNNVILEPITAYSINLNQIIFTTPPTGGSSFFCISLGSALGIGVPGEGTVNGSKLSQPFNYNNGLLYLDTATNRLGIGTTTPQTRTHIVGTGSTTLLVEGNTRITGILTVGSSSVTLDGTNNQVNVGTAVTITSSGFQIGSSSLHSTGINVTNINATGVGTFASLVVSGNVSIAGTVTYDDVTNVDSIGIVTARSGVRIDAGGLVVTAGVSTLGITSATNLTAQNLNVSGIATVVTELDVGVGGTAFTVLPSGNVGIGTTNPDGKLTLSAASSVDMLTFKNGATTFARLGHNSSSGADVFDIRGEGIVRILTGGNNERVRITSSGNVGIGTINPGTKLDVQSSSNDVLSIKGGTNATFMVFDNNSIDDYKIGGVNVVAPFVVYNNTDARYEMVFDGTGNVLIGSQTATGTASQPLQVTGGAYVSGNTGIGTTNPQYNLHVIGSFAATTKSFVIPHPTKPNYKLRYASLEGEENGIYLRGRTTENVIELPEYWAKLVDENSITVNLTPIGNKNVWVEEINNNKVYINSNSTIDCFYIVFAERKDVEKLVVEIPES